MTQWQGWIGRRAVLKGLGMGGALWVSDMMGLTGQQRFVMAADPGNTSTTQTIKADSALQRLMEGNQRFVSQKRTYPHQSLERLQELAHDQKPFAVILGCADSRVPVEMLFDAGVGDIFDIRVAGNIVTPEVLGSLEYAVAMLDTRLIMVLGHERCGAVTAAVKHTVVPGSIGTLIAAIEPAIPTGEAFSEDLVQQAVIANVNYQMEAIRRNSELVMERVLKNQLQIVGGRYDLDTGAVTLV